MNATFVGSVERAQRCIERGLTLFRDGFLVECHDAMVEALRLQLGAWSGVAESAPSEPAAAHAVHEQAWSALERSGYRRIDRLRAAAQAAELGSASPLARAASTDFDWIWAEVERLTRFSARHALTPRARSLRRFRRGSFSLASVALVLLTCYLLWGRSRAQASAIHSDAFAVKNVVDGLEATEWLLPDGTLGWVDVIPPRARTVHGIRLFNAHNTFYADRATRAVHVTAFTERGPGPSVDGAFAAFSESRSVLDLPLEASDVTRIRVEIVSYFKSGGGLAEIEIR
ncbi:MAG TPA: hypothetical protein VGJ91_04120 [Polyangiaceae bacterium]